MSDFNNLWEKGAWDGLHKGRAPIDLLWPAKELSPNARIHWARKAHAVKMARSEAYFVTRAAFKRPPKWNAVNLDIEFRPPDKRRRDRDNLIASLKAANDGIADALGIDDSRFVSTYRIGEPVKGGLVRVTISEG